MYDNAGLVVPAADRGTSRTRSWDGGTAEKEITAMGGKRMGKGRVSDTTLQRLEDEAVNRPTGENTMTVDRWQLRQIVNELRHSRQLLTWMGSVVYHSAAVYKAYEEEERAAQQERARVAAMYGRRLK